VRRRSSSSQLGGAMKMGLSREKTRISPRLSETSGAQQRKNMDFAPLVGNFRGSAEKKRKLQGIS
ncbi:hypothetical protein, partial [Waltera sp.]|uniref:hypothetical protein n=1 Tax=Waltera sp. TaxID=2815806 RepID=UPI003AB4D8F5